TSTLGLRSMRSRTSATRSQPTSGPGSTRPSSTTSSSARTRSRLGRLRGRTFSRGRMPWPTVPETLHFEGLELAPRARLQPFEREAGVAAAVEFRDRMPHCSHHSLDLVLAAFVDRELDLVRSEAPSLGRRRRAVIELNALLELCERLVARLALDLGLVDLLDLVARVCG